MPEPLRAAAGAVLAVTGLCAYYDESKVLHDVTFDLRKGELVTLIGRNGAGKTTILKSIMGLMKHLTGSIRYEGQEITRLRAHQSGRLGLAFCPEERGIFASLNVYENLTLPPVLRPGGMTLDEIYALFPNLEERRASQGTKLSGGEQQMLAIARILRTGATTLLLDEPTEGLAPVIVDQIGAAIARLKEKGLTILLVEQNFRFAASVSDCFYVIENGTVIDAFARTQIEALTPRIERYLGL
jgi:branched-chain amino acid transport system ATP-binding protein